MQSTTIPTLDAISEILKQPRNESLSTKVLETCVQVLVQELLRAQQRIDNLERTSLVREYSDRETP